MPNLKNRFHKFSALHLQTTGILLLLLLAVSLLWFSNTNSNQAVSAISAKVRFYGEYRIGNDPWHEIKEGRHIPATKGDVTLRGNFHMLTPDGEYVGIYSGDTPIAFYIDHINLTFYEGENAPHSIDIENPLYGKSLCGVYWTAHLFTIGREDPVVIRIHNPHNFGNETAIDEMLSNIAFWSGIDFERGITKSGQPQRNVGLFFVIISLILLGSALFSTLLHIQNTQILWLLGTTIFSAGIYLTYSAPGISFWRQSIAVNTSILGLSMIFYMLFIAGIITIFLQETKKAGYRTTIALGIADGIFFLLPILADVRFYDTWVLWIITQTTANIALLICLAKECKTANRKKQWPHIGMMLPLIAFELDVIATALGFWKGGFVSRYIFTALFVAALILALRVIPVSINATTMNRELELQKSRLEAEKNSIETELKERRIAIMLSQIQPHFIYNTLGTIERMCLKDPEKAFDLVRNFSLYLRGNFSELESVRPIRFAEELKHVEYYVNIEKVRFPDMKITYQTDVTDFVLPALSVQPLVENAVKHGLMRLESGGTVLIHSYETPTHFCIEVKDDGVGFDTSLPIEEKKHVGLRNIQGRLQAMVNGELHIESELGVGTRAIIMIPKEGTV